MNTVKWDPTLRVGVAEFDRDHEILVDLFNDLFQLCHSGIGGAPVRDHLSRLLAHANDHFRREEQAMRRFGYPGVAAHEAAHDTVVTELARLHAELDRGRIDRLGRDELAFIERWLTHHTTEMDRACGAFLNAQGMV